MRLSPWHLLMSFKLLGAPSVQKAHSTPTLVPSPSDPFMLYSWRKGLSETKPLITTRVKSIKGSDHPHAFAASVEQCGTSGYLVRSVGLAEEMGGVRHILTVLSTL